MKERAYIMQSQTVEWETPKSLYEELDHEFSFTLDPCATAENHKCPKYYTRQDDGLSKSWSNERVFMNPPYGPELKAWVRKASIEVKLISGAALVVGLLPAYTGVSWFHDYVLRQAEVRFLRGRLRFSNAKNSCPFASMIVIWRREK